jgi:tryptophanyl-tRNA synthetase
MEEAVAGFDGKGYGHLKTDTAEAVIEELTPIRNEYKRLLYDRAHLDRIISEGAEKARKAASVTLKDVFGRVGL